VTRHTRAALAVLLAVVALSVAATPARADYRQSYLDAVDALRRGDAQAALPLLSAAIAEQPGERARARLVGAIPEPYLPHHYLALAYARLDRCNDALREWEISTQQGALAGVPAAAAEAHRGVTECRRKVGVAPSADAAVAARAAARAALERGVQAYLDGDYDGAVATLGTAANGGEGSARALALAVRAAARQARFRLGGERDAAELAAAIADAREARRADPAFRPDPQLFSPRFLALWSQP